LIRLSNQHAKTIQVWLRVIQNKFPEAYKVLATLTSKQVEQLYRDKIITSNEFALNNMVLKPTPPEEITDILSQQINTKVDNTDLMRFLFEMFSKPYGNQSLNAQQVTALREAILTPSKLKDLKASLNKSEFHCGSCGRKMADREAVTAVADEYGQLSLHCGSCVRPTQITVYGGLTMPLSAEYYTAIDNMELEAQKRINKKVKIDVAAAVAPPGDGDTLTFAQAVNLVNGRARR
jgi:hypothetical protein